MSKIKEKQKQKRIEIVKAAIDLIKDTPFEDLSVADICAAAGISTGSFYHYFEKKSDIIIGLLMLVDEDVAENVFPLLTSEDEAENLLTLAVGFAKHVDDAGLARSWVVTGSAISDYTLSGKKREMQSMLEKIIARGQSSGKFITTRSAEVLARYFFIALRGITTDWTRRNGEYAIVEYMREYITFFLRSFIA